MWLNLIVHDDHCGNITKLEIKKKNTSAKHCFLGGGGGSINFCLFLTWTIWFGIFHTDKGFLWKKRPWFARFLEKVPEVAKIWRAGGPIGQVSAWQQQQGINTVWSEKERGGAAGEVGIFNTAEQTSTLEVVAVSLTHTHMFDVSRERTQRMEHDSTWH